jgi:hypothetical protein
MSLTQTFRRRERKLGLSSKFLFPFTSNSYIINGWEGVGGKQYQLLTEEDEKCQNHLTTFRSNIHTYIYMYIYSTKISHINKLLNFIYTVVPPYPLIQYLRFTATPKKLKIKEINGSSVSKRAPGENGS